MTLCELCQTPILDKNVQLTPELSVVHLALIAPVLEGSMFRPAATPNPMISMQALPCMQQSRSQLPETVTVQCANS